MASIAERINHTLRRPVNQGYIVDRFGNDIVVVNQGPSLLKGFERILILQCVSGADQWNRGMPSKDAGYKNQHSHDRDGGPAPPLAPGGRIVLHHESPCVVENCQPLTLR